MKRTVVDASLAIAWVYVGQASEESEKMLVAVRAGGGIVVPSIWFAEVANAMLSLLRRKRIGEPEHLDLLVSLKSLVVEVDERSVRSIIETSDLARKHGLSVYDACYLATAMRGGYRIATLDGALRKAAQTAGVELVTSASRGA